MAIKKLYTNGDSWTYGQELGDGFPDELDYKFYNTWPWFLSRHMKIPQVINDGLGGGSCDRIFRKTVDYIKSQDTIEDTIFVLGWTSEERFEWPSKVKKVFHDGWKEDYWEEINYISMLFSTEISNIGNSREYTDTIMRLNGLRNKWFRIREYDADLKKVEQYVYILNELVKGKGSKIYHFWALGEPIQQHSIFPKTLIDIVIEKEWSVCTHRHPTEETQQKIADIIYDKIQSTAK